MTQIDPYIKKVNLMNTSARSRLGFNPSSVVRPVIEFEEVRGKYSFHTWNRPKTRHFHEWCRTNAQRKWSVLDDDRAPLVYFEDEGDAIQFFLMFGS